MCLKTLSSESSFLSPYLANSYSHLKALSKCPLLCKANRHISGLDKPLAEDHTDLGASQPFLAEPCIGL